MNDPRGALVYYIELWWEMERHRFWSRAGVTNAAPVHRMAVSSRQWDESDDVQTSQLNVNSALIIERCLDNLQTIQKILVMLEHCHGYDTSSTRGSTITMTASEKLYAYEQAMIRLAKLARSEGLLDV